MTSPSQIEANRRNALKSTGPTSEQGKMRSRRNAIRHGLTAETVIDGLEDPEDYKAFEAAVSADFDAQTAVERELVLRLASLLWRLRRATAIETGLLQAPAAGLSISLSPNQACEMTCRHPRTVLKGSTDAGLNIRSNNQDAGLGTNGHEYLGMSDEITDDDRVEVAKRLMHLGTLDNQVFERLSRYETALWRQVAQTLFVLGELGSPNRYARSPLSHRAGRMPSGVLSLGK